MVDNILVGKNTHKVVDQLHSHVLLNRLLEKEKKAQVNEIMQ